MKNGTVGLRVSDQRRTQYCEYNTPQLLDQKVSDAKLIFVLYYAAFYFKDL